MEPPHTGRRGILEFSPCPPPPRPPWGVGSSSPLWSDPTWLTLLGGGTGLRSQAWFGTRRSGWDVPGRAWKAFAEGTDGGGNTHKEAEDRGSEDPRP